MLQSHNATVAVAFLIGLVMICKHPENLIANCSEYGDEVVRRGVVAVTRGQHTSTLMHVY